MSKEQLIQGAAEAAELFDEDELERYAERQTRAIEAAAAEMDLSRALASISSWWRKTHPELPIPALLFDRVLEGWRVRRGDEPDTEPQRQRPKPAKEQPSPPDPLLPKGPVTREAPKQSAALIVHDLGDGQVGLELVYPEGVDGGDNMPLTALVAAHAMEYITGISQGDE